MTESHCPNNLLRKVFTYFEEQIIPSWNNSIKALKSTEHVLKQALHLGLVDHCIESLVSKAINEPRLLGEPIKILTSDDPENESISKPKFRRKLFDLDWKSEDLTTLSLRLYVHTIRGMIHRQVPQEYIAANLCQYAKKWLFCDENKIGETLPIYKRDSQREIIEALEKLLPHEKGLLPCTFLFQMLRFSMSLGAKTECKNGLEIRIGNQLDQASVHDLLIPSQGYTKDEQYDTECVRRILTNFYNYDNLDASGLNSVSELIDEFLAEISSDIDLKPTTFLTFADMSLAISRGTQRTSDGIYRAVNIYLDKHRHLTESESEELCGVLDINKLSNEASEHAAQNERLPLRVVVQVLFLSQLKLRDTIVKEVKDCDDEEVKEEMEKMGSKVLELEKECCVMKRQILGGKEKVGIWKEMKRKLGCGTSVNNDHNCHVKKKKVHPR
ncbi:hypothetical protein ACJIZ3_016459 [Penstemon smallii]|uniref:NPH3 domain-containing protein n=1 Tax=Penstemon smallii TaxID=265156 RepID=A0ABD3RTB9_9LAMI